MSKSSKLWLVVVGLLVVAGGITTALLMTPDSDLENQVVEAPKDDPKPKQEPPQAEAQPTAKKSRVGKFPRIPADLNPQVASVAEALKTGTHPERVSVQTLPAAFDLVAFEQDPDAYLNVNEPGRVWQSAQPGPDVPRIRPASPMFTEIEQGESAPLRVKVTPGMPVTFTSFDGGEFQNRLNSITLRADEEGVATARFTGSSGTVNYVSILASSPVMAGQLQYIINVQLPRPTEDNGEADDAPGNG